MPPSAGADNLSAGNRSFVCACCVFRVAPWATNTGGSRTEPQYRQTEIFYRALQKGVNATAVLPISNLMCDNLAPPGGYSMDRRFLSILACLIVTTSAVVAAPKKSENKDGPVPDKALLQKIWDGWATLDPANTAQFYAAGQHTFFDIAPLKYDSWDEYQAGVKKVLADFKSAKFMVNDDVQLHPAGEYVWGTATVKEDAVMKSGKHEMATFRWTVVFTRQEGKWLIVHEHISEPLS